MTGSPLGQLHDGHPSQPISGEGWGHLSGGPMRGVGGHCDKPAKRVAGSTISLENQPSASLISVDPNLYNLPMVTLEACGRAQA